MARILKSFNFSNVNVKDALCCGFTSLKQGTKVDYTFVIEVKWTDNRTSYVKRTYMDFLNLQYNLMNVFPPEKNKTIFGTKKKPLPMLPAVKKSLIVDDIETAEQRELELYKYCKELVNQPKKVLHSQVLQSFFSSRAEDPKPYNPSQNKINGNTKKQAPQKNKVRKPSMGIDKYAVQFGQMTQLPKRTTNVVIVPKSPSYTTQAPSYNREPVSPLRPGAQSYISTTGTGPYTRAHSQKSHQETSKKYHLYYGDNEDKDDLDVAKVTPVELRVSNIYEALPTTGGGSAKAEEPPDKGETKQAETRPRKKLSAPKDLAITPDISPESSPHNQRRYISDFL